MGEGACAYLPIFLSRLCTFLQRYRVSNEMTVLVIAYDHHTLPSEHEARKGLKQCSKGTVRQSEHDAEQLWDNHHGDGTLAGLCDSGFSPGFAPFQSSFLQIGKVHLGVSAGSTISRIHLCLVQYFFHIWTHLSVQICLIFWIISY